jgi:hypothetical protein
MAFIYQYYRTHPTLISFHITVKIRTRVRSGLNCHVMSILEIVEGTQQFIVLNKVFNQLLKEILYEN